MTKIGALFLALSVAAGAALGQGTPTGIVTAGAVTLLHTEGKISVGTTPPVESITDAFGGGFAMLDYTNYTPPPTSPVTMIDVCLITTTTGPTSTPPPTGLVVTPLDAGPVFNINGPNGMKQVSKANPSSSILGGGVPIPIPGFPPPPPVYLVPGTYTVDNGAGGADIGPFSVTLTVSDPVFTWTNADDDLSIDRSVGVDVAWTGGDPGAKVYIQGVSSVVDPATFKLMSAGAFTCVVDNSAGHYFVSPDVLAILPASSTAPNTASFSTLTAESATQTSFDAPGSGTSLFLFQSGAGRSVAYK